MKITLIAAVIAMAAAPSFAGINKALIRSNVACDAGSAPGFTLNNVAYIAEAAAASCGDRAANYRVVPSGVDVHDLGEVLAYLGTIGETSVTPVYSNGAEVIRNGVFDKGRDRW